MAGGGGGCGLEKFLFFVVRDDRRTELAADSRQVVRYGIVGNHGSLFFDWVSAPAYSGRQSGWNLNFWVIAPVMLCPPDGVRSVNCFWM